MKYAVLIRQLPGSRPVAMEVIEEPDSCYQVDDLDHYFNSKAENIKKRFIEQFCEFSEAKFYLDII
jgi:hypothetical protein